LYLPIHYFGGIGAMFRQVDDAKPGLAQPETSSTVDSFIGGLPSFLTELNLAIVAFVVNLVVMVAVSALTRRIAPSPPSGRFERSSGQVEWSASR
jgi:hypothetical protein